MDTKIRREKIHNLLNEACEPISASALAEEFSVSRQIIVGDIALLRAGGSPVTATPRGYVLKSESSKSFPYIGLIACKHDMNGLKKELYAIVDYGGTVIDVIVEHSIYGQLSGLLNIASRYDADQFMEKVNSQEARPLSNLTGGIHLHHIGCKNIVSFGIIKNKLEELGVSL